MSNDNKQKTIYDISQVAGVSIATVSRVINNSGNVSEKTKKKVIDVINQMDYAPNIFARGLGTGSTKTIGILCADVADMYLANSVSFLERELRKKGFDTILNCTGYDLKEKIKGMRAMEQRKVDAVIMVGSHYVEASKAKNRYIVDTARRIPVMMQNGYIDGENIYCVLSDDYEEFRNATQYLIDKGARNIVFLYREETYSRNRKYNGYCDALKANGIDFDEGMILQSNARIQETKKDVETFFEQGKKADAILACDDELAIGALKYLQEAGVSVPDDIMLIGCNNSVLSITSAPELTSVDNLCEVLCITLVQSLMRILNDEKTANRTIISGHLVERGSTAGKRG